MKTNNISLTIAISTLNGGILNCSPLSIMKDERINVIYIHQVTHDCVIDFTDIYNKLMESYANVKIITTHEVGLSLSRNMAIDCCETDYLIFSDDDNDYISNLYDLVARYIHHYNEPELLSFKITDKKGQPFKVYSEREYKHSNRTLMRLSSIENIYKRKFLIENKIRFNELFGLGATYPSCEQPLFGRDILNNNGRAFYVPEVLAYHPLENSGDMFYTTKNALARKKMFQIFFGEFLGTIVYIYFSFTKLKKVPKGKKISYLRLAFNERNGSKDL